MGYIGSSSHLRQKWRLRSSLLVSHTFEGSGNTDGVLLPLDMVGSGVYQVAYTVPIQVGTNHQNLSLQVDTGSSDLWIASTSCSSSDCTAANSRLYDPGSSSTATNESFTINYLQGNVSGPIVWDTIQIGGYSINNQALAAATSVEAEPLAYDFNGILGLALPLNSIIAETIPPVTNNHPDGASFSSNLFGITPVSEAPSAPFLSLVLSRPGSDRLPALLGIGHHPSNIVPDPSKIKYSTLATDSSGMLFWKVNVRAITIYVNGDPKPVGLGRGVKGTLYPTAVLDSGIPLILTTSNIANGIYGALGIGPAADGQYYVPCTTPLNMTMTFDGQGEISLHPLDLTSPPPDNLKSENCIGLIQAADITLLNPQSDIGDMILGVPFMRNTYTVMAYEEPNADGSFEENATSETIHPRLGLLGLTDPTIALQEFNTVRVLNEPLPPSSSNGKSNATTSEKKMSVGINVLIGLVGFFSACVVLFVLWWYFVKRRAARAEAENGEERPTTFMPYRLAKRRSNPSLDDPSSISTLQSSRGDDIKKRDMTELGYNEFCRQSSARDKVHDVNDPWDPRNYSMAFRDSIYEPEPLPAFHPPEHDTRLEVITRPDHQRTTSELRSSPQSVMVPLLARPHHESPSDDLAEFGLYEMPSMAGVGTAARGSKIDTGCSHSRVGSAGSNITASSSPSQRLSLFPRPLRPSSQIYPSSTETDVGHEF